MQETVNFYEKSSFRPKAINVNLDLRRYDISRSLVVNTLFIVLANT